MAINIGTYDYVIYKTAQNWNTERKDGTTLAAQPPTAVGGGNALFNVIAEIRNQPVPRRARILIIGDNEVTSPNMDVQARQLDLSDIQFLHIEGTGTNPSLGPSPKASVWITGAIANGPLIKMHNVAYFNFEGFVVSNSGAGGHAIQVEYNAKFGRFFRGGATQCAGDGFRILSSQVDNLIFDECQGTGCGVGIAFRSQTIDGEVRETPNQVLIWRCRFEANTSAGIVIEVKNPAVGGNSYEIGGCIFHSGGVGTGIGMDLKGGFGIHTHDCYFEMAPDPFLPFVKIRNAINGTTETYWAHDMVFRNCYFHQWAVPNDWYVQWMANTSYALEANVRPTGPKRNGFHYTCVVAGTSSSQQPNWPTTEGMQFQDGGVTWETHRNTVAYHFDVDYCFNFTAEQIQHRGGQQSQPGAAPLIHWGLNTKGCHADFRSAVEDDRANKVTASPVTGDPLLVFDENPNKNWYTWWDPTPGRMKTVGTAPWSP